jgi:DNA-binding FadR family transcriptional regulator
LLAISKAFHAMEKAQNIGQWIEADLEFHTAILSATNNPLLMPLAAIIGSALESLLGVTARNANDFRLALPEHKKVFEAIQHGDSQSALHRMAGMLSDTRALMRRAVFDAAGTQKTPG